MIQQPPWGPAPQPPSYQSQQVWPPQGPPWYGYSGYQQPGPVKYVSRGKLSPAETVFHAAMTFLTGGFWGIVWWARVHQRTTVTTIRR